MDSYPEYCYVDAHCGTPNKTPWKRIKVEEIEKFRHEYNNIGIFTTIQHFKNPQRIEDEPVYMGLYFDFDHEESGGEKARQDVVKLREFFYQGASLIKEEVRFFYSGSKGFHIRINPVTLGIKPSPHLHKYFKEVALIIEEELGLTTLDLKSIYGSRRQWRLLDSKHEGSGRFKIELDPSELDKSLEEIRTMAAKPRGPLYTEEPKSLNETAQAFFEHYFDRAKINADRDYEKRDLKKDIFLLKNYPACIKNLLEKSIRKLGHRNDATMLLGSYFKDSGKSYQQALDILIPWAKAIPQDLTSARGSKLSNSTTSAVKTVYESPIYSFQCPLVWSLNAQIKEKEEKIVCKQKTCRLHPSYLVPKSHAELQKEKIEPVRYFIENLLPERGKCIVSAETNIGKTFFMQNVAVGITSGKAEFLKRFVFPEPKTKRKVLYLDGEMGLSLVLERFNIMTVAENIEPLNDLYIRHIPDMDLLKMDDKRKLEYWLKMLGVDILIIDPTASFWHGDENNQQDVGYLTSYLNSLISKFKVGIVLVRHWRKKTKDFKRGGQMASGSHQWLDWTDFHICLEEKATGIVISCEKSRGVPRFEPFLTKLNRDSLWFEFLTDFKQKVDESTLAQLFDEFHSDKVALPELSNLAEEKKICSRTTIRKLIKKSPNFEIDDSGKTHYLIRKNIETAETEQDEASLF